MDEENIPQSHFWFGWPCQARKELCSGLLLENGKNVAF